MCSKVSLINSDFVLRCSKIYSCFFSLSTTVALPKSIPVVPAAHGSILADTPQGRGHVHLSTIALWQEKLLHRNCDGIGKQKAASRSSNSLGGRNPERLALPSPVRNAIPIGARKKFLLLWRINMKSTLKN